MTDKPSVKVSWLVTGVRKDPYAEANRLEPEVTKEPENIGRYLNPGVYSKAENVRSRRDVVVQGEQYVSQELNLKLLLQSLLDN